MCLCVLSYGCVDIKSYNKENKKPNRRGKKMQSGKTRDKVTVAEVVDAWLDSNRKILYVYTDNVVSLLVFSFLLSLLKVVFKKLLKTTKS